MAGMAGVLFPAFGAYLHCTTKVAPSVAVLELPVIARLQSRPSELAPMQAGLARKFIHDGLHHVLRSHSDASKNKLKV